MVEMWRTRNGCTETDAYLHRVNWERHVVKRSEIEGLQEAARQTVEDPDFAIQDAGGVVFKYRMGFGSGKRRHLWLRVIEAPDGRGAHVVKTVYFTREIVEGEALCIRRLWEK